MDRILTQFFAGIVRAKHQPDTYLWMNREAVGGRMSETIGKKPRWRDQQWFKPGYLVAILLILALAPCAWVITLKWANVPMTSPVDPFGMAETLAALMGGVFAAAGVVVALGSIVAALTIEERVKRQMEIQFEGYRGQADRQIQAFQLLEQSRNQSWGEAIDTVERALTLHPELPDAQRQLALKLFDDYLTDFIRTHSRAQEEVGTETAVDTNIISGWLERAIAAGQNRDFRLTAAQSVLIGAGGRYPALLHALRKMPKETYSASDWRKYLRDHSILMLVSCCKSATDLREVGELIGMRLPLDCVVIQSEAALKVTQLSKNSHDPMLYTASLWCIPKPDKWPALRAGCAPIHLTLDAVITTGVTAPGVRLSALALAVEEMPQSLLNAPNGMWALNDAIAAIAEVCWIVFAQV